MSVLLKGGIYEVHRLDTKFHDEPIGHLRNIKAIARNIWEAAVLVLLMGGFYEVPYVDGLKCHDIHIRFHDNRLK
jgi:hypothetical protein